MLVSVSRNQYRDTRNRPKPTTIVRHTPRKAGTRESQGADAHTRSNLLCPPQARSCMYDTTSGKAKPVFRFVVQQLFVVPVVIMKANLGAVLLSYSYKYYCRSEPRGQQKTKMLTKTKRKSAVDKTDEC